VITDRFHETRSTFYSFDWEKQYFTLTYPIAEYENKKPDNLEEIYTVSQKLSSDFIYARVDLYDIDGKIIFGEITHNPGAGFDYFLPDGYPVDLFLGGLLELPGKKKIIK
jgi:hypothetical protein